MKTTNTKNRKTNTWKRGLQALALTAALGMGSGLSAQNYEWANGIGGTSPNEGISTATDVAGNIYVTGHFRGTADFDPGAGMANLTSNGNRDMFLAKYDATGAYQWAVSMGGGLNDIGNSVAVDGSGNALVTGQFLGTADFDPGAGVANLTSNGSADIFLAKYDATGAYQWAINMGGTSSDVGTAVTVDGSGNVLVNGYFRNTTDFDPGAGVANLTSNGNRDIFLAKYDATGAYQWAINVGGTFSDVGNSVAVDGSGNALVTGSFDGMADFDPGAGVANLTSTGISTEIFLAKYDATGAYQWAISVGGTSIDVGYSVAVDGSGNALVTGSFSSIADFDPSAGVANLISNGGIDIFLAKYDATGVYQWAINMGGTSSDKGYSVAVDGIGNALVTGYFRNTADFDHGDGVANLTSNSRDDIFLAKYDATGAYQWAINVGGIQDDTGNSVAVDGSGNALVTGRFWNTADFDPSSGTANLTSDGNTDIFLAKYRDTTFVAMSGDTALSLVSDSTWRLSTVVTTATANSYPWPGVMSTPATPTFTLPVDVNQPYPWEHLYTVAGSEVITAQSGVTYYRKTFDLVDPAGIQARFRVFVDDNMEIFINGHWIALEDDMGQYNWRTVNHDLLFNGDGTSTNGNAGGDAFDYVTGADMDTVFKAGTNEIILAIRNRTSKPDLGGFSFRMDLDKGAVKKAGSVARSTNNVVTADSKLIIFPNPTSGNITVALNHTAQTTTEGTVTVFDFSGKQIISQSIYSETELNLNSLPAGVYLVKVTSGVETFTQKVIKQ